MQIEDNFLDDKKKEWQMIMDVILNNEDGFSDIAHKY